MTPRPFAFVIVAERGSYDDQEYCVVSVCDSAATAHRLCDEFSKREKEAEERLKQYSARHPEPDFEDNSDAWMRWHERSNKFIERLRKKTPSGFRFSSYDPPLFRFFKVPVFSEGSPDD